jgi:hypothetical protein
MKPERLCEQEQVTLYDLQYRNVEEWHSPLVHKLERGVEHGN